MRRLRTGIIGCGKVSHIHAKALKELPESEFTAVFSRFPEKAEIFAQQYGIKGYSNFENILHTSGVEVVVVCTPHLFHAEPTIKSLNAGIHALVEKPLASSLKDCDEMTAEARASKCKLGTVSQRRWYAPVRRVRQAIEEGKIGEPGLGVIQMLGWRDQAYYDSDPWRGTWSMEGAGVLVNQAPHQLDLLQWFMGPIEEVFGYWVNLNHSYIEVEDTAVAVIHFQNGGLGNILVSNSQKPGIYSKAHVHGGNGASVGVQIDGGAMFIAGKTKILEPPINDLWTINGEEHLLELWKEEDSAFFQSIDATTFYHKLQVQDFLQAIIKDRDPLVSGEERRKTVELFTALYQSNRDRVPVRFPIQSEEGQKAL